MNPIDSASLRREYMRADLDAKDVDADPFRQFDKWFREAVASALHLPNSAMFATASRAGQPTARAVLLKGMDERGFVFFTNYESRKGKELAGNPRCCLLFAWEELERQVRIDGTVEKTSAKESEEYFRSRPLGARLGAWASPQSEVLRDRAALQARLAEVSRRFGDDPPCPPHWGGYRVLAEAIEFWQGRADRLHDRIQYRRGEGGWIIERLAP